MELNFGEIEEDSDGEYETITTVETISRPVADQDQDLPPPPQETFSAKRKPPLPQRGKNGFRGGAQQRPPRSHSTDRGSSISHEERNTFYLDKTIHILLFGHFYNESQFEQWQKTFHSLVFCLTSRYPSKNLSFHYIASSGIRTLPEAFLNYFQQKHPEHFKNVRLNILFVKEEEKLSMEKVTHSEHQIIDSFIDMKRHPNDLFLVISFVFENSQICMNLSKVMQQICWDNQIKFIFKKPGFGFSFAKDFDGIIQHPFYNFKGSSQYQHDEYPPPRKRVLEDISYHPSEQYYDPQTSYSEAPPVPQPQAQRHHDDSDDDARILSAKQILDLKNPERKTRLLQRRNLPETTESKTEVFFHPNQEISKIVTITTTYFP